ncbi:MAG: ATP-dependent DNA helicase RecG [Verrucomicrobia bacterium]|nr:ATP-dependent DNA helicase RecG [Verrucomicrobiota bacterium]
MGEVSPSGATALDQPLAHLRGVGPERATQLARLGLHSLGDLLAHRPRRYEDRRWLSTIAELRLGTTASSRGRIVAQGLKRWRHGQRSLFEMILDDHTGRLHCRWWNLPYLERHYQVGAEVIVFGKLTSLRPPTLDHPEAEVVEPGEETSVHLQRIVPVYPLTEGLPQRWLRTLVWRALESHAGQIPEPWPGRPLPDLPSRAQAFQQLHFPDELATAERARQRLALDEFIDLQLAIQRRRQSFEARATAWPCAGDNRLIRPFLARLGYTLTAAQTRVLRELRGALAGPLPMRRLLQGDVGSGKTAVAACAALMTIESGHAVVLMAPTEILAEQHYRTFRAWFDPLDVPVAIRTGSRRDNAPAPAAQALPGHASPPLAPGLTVGTHALIEADFQIERLGLVIIDEQHKFGVSQRERLVRKGHYPHLLVLTATPIPRTLGLTLYDDLDVSTIDELPAGRGLVRTFVRGAASLPKVWEFVRAQLAAGRQAYVVYPRIEEGDLATGLKALREEFGRVSTVLAPHRTGLLHGQLPAAAKEQVMAAFRAREIHVLVATSVIEVGVDVPNATLMVIENADHYGLAQLHQLRGRIGRGPHPAYCILIASARTLAARQRLRVLERTTDGFRLAEEDLRLRGPGELLGQAQSGFPRLHFGSLTDDLPLIQQARAWVRERLARASDPQAWQPPASC